MPTGGNIKLTRPHNIIAIINIGFKTECVIKFLCDALKIPQDVFGKSISGHA